MTGARASRTDRLRPLMIAGLIAGTAIAGGCALTHKRAPATQELTLDYAPPTLQGIQPVDAAIKVRRFSALSPYDSTSMYFKSATGSQSHNMESFNYYQWVTSPGNRVTDLLYRDLAAAHVFRDVFPYTSTEQSRFQLEGTVLDFVMVQRSGSWQARLALRLTLVDSQAQRGPGRVVLQREFEATQALESNSAEQYAAGMSEAMKKVSEEILRAVHVAAGKRLSEGTGSA